MEYPYLYIYTVCGYDRQEGETFFDIVSINVYAESEQEALDKAKKLVKKPLYRMAGCQEVLDHDRMQYLNVQSQVKVQEKLVNYLNPKEPWEKHD